MFAMRTLARSLTIAGLVALAAAARSDEVGEKLVGTDWTWLTDYIYATATWTLNVEDDCRVEVGTGVKAFGNPRGSRHSFEGHHEFTTWGAGAIHVRVVRGVPPCLVRLDQGEVGAITVYKQEI